MTAQRPPDQHGDILVFAYGSLMWRPEFDHIDIQPAILKGYHRSLCIFSYEYRGNRENPGLVFGLEQGGTCMGRVLKVNAGKADGVLDYLYQREMITGVYLPRWLEVDLPEQQTSATAYCFVADQQHEQFCGKLELEETIRLILQGHGSGGACLDYVINTYEHMQKIGIEDNYLAKIIALAKEKY